MPSPFAVLKTPLSYLKLAPLKEFAQSPSLQLLTTIHGCMPVSSYSCKMWCFHSPLHLTVTNLILRYTNTWTKSEPPLHLCPLALSVTGTTLTPSHQHLALLPPQLSQPPQLPLTTVNLNARSCTPHKKDVETKLLGFDSIKCI